MLIFSVIVLFLATWFALWRLVRRLHRIPALGAMPVTMALFIGLESVTYNGLSLAHLLTPIWVGISHLGVLGIWLIWEMRRKGGHFRTEWQYLYRAIKYQITRHRLLIPLILLLLVTALIYPPNNYDSMTYHMARVAHWMQNRSVAFYPTSIGSQNAMGPGAEYLVLFFQILTQSDFLANCIQFLAYIIILLSLEYICRLAHLPKKIRVWTAVICVTAPMALMQATSTQNDLVASVMFLAVVISGARLFYGKIGRMRKGEYFLFGASIGSAFLVKPTALVVAMPLFIGGSLCQLRSIDGRVTVKKAAAGMLIAIVAAGIIAGPDIIRKGTKVVHRPEVYPLFSDWNIVRLWNPVAIIGGNIPFAQEVKTALGVVGFKGKLYMDNVLFPHEDFVGNPVQVLLILGLTLLTLLLTPLALTKRGRFFWALISLYPAAAWMTFGLIVKNQAWITRLQLPLLFTLPFGFVLILKILHNHRRLHKAFEVAICTIAIFSLAQGYVVACDNWSRPLKLRYFWGQFPSREAAYYKNNKGVKNADDHLLETAETLQCKRIGLIMGGDSYDYPLTWRAMERGLKTRHVRSDPKSEWPCMLYVSDVSLKSVPGIGDNWLLASRDGKSFYRNPEKTADTSLRICTKLNDALSLGTIKPLHQVSVAYVPDGMLIQSDGIDPQVLLPRITCTHQGQPILKVVMESSVKTVLQVFYLVPGERYYARLHSVREQVLKGRNILFIKIPRKALSTPLRLDPGQRPGRYLLRSVEMLLASNSAS